jgi:hypothetical protein
MVGWSLQLYLMRNANLCSGGGRTLDEKSNTMRQTTDQERSAFGLGLKRAKDMRSPVAIIAGKFQHTPTLNMV